MRRPEGGRPPPDPKDGCPTDDPDKDGIRGDADKCPNEPETVNGYKDDDGCPDEKPQVEVTDTSMAKKSTTRSCSSRARRNQPASDKLIENIAKVIKENPDVDYVEVAGHADKRGVDASNRILTRATPRPS